MARRPIPPITIQFLKMHEGCKLQAYRDSGGVWTVGYGSTGPEVVEGLKITQAQADAYLAGDIREAAGKLDRKVKPAIIAELTDNQYAALLSFVFNLGTPGTTIWKRLNAAQFDQVPPEMARFVYCKGKKLNGLVKRRAAEMALWASGEPGATEEHVPSSVTRRDDVDTPPANADPDPMIKKPSVIAAAGAAVSAAASQAPTIAANTKSAIDTVSGQVQPYADSSPMIGNALSALGVVAAILAVVILAMEWWKKHRSKG